MKTSEEKIFYTLSLLQLKGIGLMTARNLIKEFGSAEAVFREKPKNLRKIPRIGEILAANSRTCRLHDAAEREVLFMQQHGIEGFCMDDPDYPQRLLDCQDAPVLLFYIGKADLNAKHIISVVGTRSSTPYGQELIRDFMKDLSKVIPDALIVSGLAYGIDVTAHREAMKNNLPTVGILAHGLNMIYPDAHRPIAQEMLANGGLLTEYTANTKPEKGFFLARNRIIAGITDATIVVETADKGGSIVTASIANSYNREVCAFPGRIYDPRSKGCNRLIRQQAAALITNADDFLELMNWKSPQKKIQAQQLPIDFGLDEQEKAVYHLMAEQGDMQLNELAEKTGMSIQELTGILMELELRNKVRCLPGSMYHCI